MAHRRKNRRRRRGRLSFLYKALSIILICAAIVGALVIFFKVDNVEVTGAERYDTQAVLSASGIKSGQNLILLNKYTVAERIFNELPYVESVQINRRLPDTICITVKECTSVAAIGQDGGAFLLCGTGKIVERVASADGAAVVTGVSLSAPTPGAMATAAPGSEAAFSQLLTILQQLENKNMLAATQEIHLEDADLIRVRYDNRFTVEFAWGADFSYKLDNLTAVIAQLQPNEKGTINLTQDGKANFIPD